MKPSSKSIQRSLLTMIFPFFIVALVGCTKEKSDTTLRLAASTSVASDSGLLNILLPAFERESGIKTEVYATGSGKALEAAKKGKADVVLTHTRTLEDQFIAEGYGINASEVMYNEFVLVGPLDDPAGLKGSTDIVKAFKTIASKKVLFISRGDMSGTNEREVEIWNLAGVRPAGELYKEAKAGMIRTLQIASQEKGYCLTVLSTYLHKKSELRLQIVVEGDKRLRNPYRVIAVNPQKVSGVNYKNAMAFIDFLISDQIQAKIAELGVKETGQQYFFPSAERKIHPK